MKYPIMRLFPVRRPYRIVLTSAVALVGASATVVLVSSPEVPGRSSVPAGSSHATAAVSEQEQSPAAVLAVPRAPVPSPTASPPAARSAEEPSPAVSSTAAARPVAASSSPDPDVAAAPKPVAPPSSAVLDVDYQAQTTYYYCGPAAVRIALTARDVERSQDDLASRLGTTYAGTNSAEDTTRVLNDVLGRDVYRTRVIGGSAATPAQMDRLQADVVSAISKGYAVVANIAGSATDVDGRWHSFPGGHYLTVVGYRDDGRAVKIADPANPAVGTYWMTTITLAHWIATRGYST